MDSSRFLYDDGHAASCWAALMKAQGALRVGSWAAAGLDAASRMRQVYNETTKVTDWLVKLYDEGNDEFPLQVRWQCLAN